jgi:hypothetical protein
MMYNESIFLELRKQKKKKLKSWPPTTKEKKKKKEKSSGLWILSSLVSCLCILSEESWILSSLGLFASLKSLMKKLVDWKQRQGPKEKKNKVSVTNWLGLLFVRTHSKGAYASLGSGDWLMCLRVVVTDSCCSHWSRQCHIHVLCSLKTRWLVLVIMISQ